MKNLNRILVVFVLLVMSSQANAIKKCRDADGKWHYGDTAVAACENSKITELTDRGFVKREQQAPKSEAELIADEKALAIKNEEEEKRRQKQEERTRILSIYETEADIDRQKNNQLVSVEGNIAVHKAYIKGMGAKITRIEEKIETASAHWKEKFTAEIETSKKRIIESNKEIAVLEEKKKQIAERFTKEKELYRELKVASEE